MICISMCNDQMKYRRQISIFAVSSIVDATACARFITDNWILMMTYRDQVETPNSTNENNIIQNDPNNDVWYKFPNRHLLSKTHVLSFCVGGGASVMNSILSKCALATEEVIITTCFWSKSRSQESISSLLLHLSQKGMQRHRRIRVRLCFSSLSLVQKIFHPRSLKGKYYPKKSWVKKLNLPVPEALEGIDLVVKSIFIRPFSVMHPKFIIIDHKRVFLPSCNVSWENWFEGCIEFEGEIVIHIYQFWQNFWSSGLTSESSTFSSSRLERISQCHEIVGGTEDNRLEGPQSTSQSLLIKELVFSNRAQAVSAILLPSSHHANPRFNMCICSTPDPPSTPLNLFLLNIFHNARSSIYIQTANFTSSPVLIALVSALTRGVDVHLVTNERLMRVEQLLTAGTTTSLTVAKLRKRYRSIARRHACRCSDNIRTVSQAPGVLKIGYYHVNEIELARGEPNMSHLKMVIVDQAVLVLGSGNMDRASWYTSQELGAAFLDNNLTREVGGIVHECLKGRVNYIC